MSTTSFVIRPSHHNATGHYTPRPRASSSAHSSRVIGFLSDPSVLGAAYGELVAAEISEERIRQALAPLRESHRDSLRSQAVLAYDLLRQIERY